MFSRELEFNDTTYTTAKGIKQSVRVAIRINIVTKAFLYIHYLYIKRCPSYSFKLAVVPTFRFALGFLLVKSAVIRIGERIEIWGPQQA